MSAGQGRSGRQGCSGSLGDTRYHWSPVCAILTCAVAGAFGASGLLAAPVLGAGLAGAGVGAAQWIGKHTNDMHVLPTKAAVTTATSKVSHFAKQVESAGSSVLHHVLNVLGFHGKLPPKPASMTQAHYKKMLNQAAYLESHPNAQITAHRAAGHPTPTQGRVATVWQGVKRAKGTAQKGKAAARTQEVRAMVDTCGDGLIGTRDRALLLVGFAGAFRRSELVGLDVDDLDFGRDGLTITIGAPRPTRTAQGSASAFASADLPCAVPAGVGRGGGHRKWSGVPLSGPAR